MVIGNLYVYIDRSGVRGDLDIDIQSQDDNERILSIHLIPSQSRRLEVVAMSVIIIHSPLIIRYP